MKNTVQLITYPDRLCEGGISGLHKCIKTCFPDLFGGVHLLPFYTPFDGKDNGFDPVDHTCIDPRTGTAEDVKQLAKEMDLTADMIVNHMSCDSRQFMDVLARGELSPYQNLFLQAGKIFAQGERDPAAGQVYQTRTGSLFTRYKMKQGGEIPFWTTFTPQQIDIDVRSAAGRDYLDDVLRFLAGLDVHCIRLDAVGFTVKTPGTDCFVTKDTLMFISELSAKAQKYGISCLAEVHAPLNKVSAVAERVDFIYDFALTPLVLHTLYSGSADELIHWLQIPPFNRVTVLDTHDGIGVYDACSDGPEAGLLSQEHAQAVAREIHRRSRGQSLEASGIAAGNIDEFQVNCSLYDALGRDDLLYLAARAIQLFSPGIPQIYYAGLLAATNDMALLKKTGNGRDINRPYFTMEKTRQALTKPVVRAQLELIRLRNTYPAFNGRFSCSKAENTLVLRRTQRQEAVQLTVNLKAGEGYISLFRDGECYREIHLSDLLRGAGLLLPEERPF